MTDSTGHFTYDGQLKGHGGWVTSLACPKNNPNQLLSASRDKTCILWEVNPGRSYGEDASETDFGFAKKRLEGHSDVVSDCQISDDGTYALTGSWDKSLRLWEMKSGQGICKFSGDDGHKKDCTTVAFSSNNRQIASGGRDNSIKMWNTIGECKFTVNDQPHTEWVSCVRFSPNATNIVSGSWDTTVKVWNANNLQCQATLGGKDTENGHTQYVETVALSPDGSLCASGGRDGKAKLWDLDRAEHLYELEANEQIHALAFSPVRYWLVAACEKSIKIWDLESKSTVAELVPELPPMGRKAMRPECISLQWSADGSTLYSGYTDNTIRVWGVREG